MSDRPSAPILLLSLAGFSLSLPAAVPSLAAGNEGGAELSELPPVKPAEVEQAAPQASDIRLEFRPNQVSLNRSISFDENGEPRHRQENLSVNLMCRYVSEHKPLGYTNVVFESAETSSGEMLDVNELNQQNQRRQFHHHGDNGSEFQLYFSLPSPKRFANSIKELRGTMTLELSEGEARGIRLEPIEKFLDRRFRIADMDGLVFSLKKAGDDNPHRAGRLEFIHPRHAQPLIQEVRFYSQQGMPLDANRQGSSSSNSEVRQYYEMPQGENNVMVIELFRSTQTVEVPFVIRDIPLPVPEAADAPIDLAVETVPLAEADRAGKRGAGAAMENLEVILLE